MAYAPSVRAYKSKQEWEHIFNSAWANQVQTLFLMEVGGEENDCEDVSFCEEASFGLFPEREREYNINPRYILFVEVACPSTS
jgi:hypothetical protein